MTQNRDIFARLFSIIAFTTVLFLLWNSPVSAAATQGSVVNLCGGVGGGGCGYCNGGGAYNDGECTWFAVGAPVKIFACGADQGTDTTQCPGPQNIGGNVEIENWTLGQNMLSGGYWQIGRSVWPVNTSGSLQNDWICKVQIDVFDYSNNLKDFVVWRDPGRCGTTPPPSTAPWYTAVSPTGGATIGSFYPTFVWNTNVTSANGSSLSPAVTYQGICVGTSSSSNPCPYGPSLDARTFTATQALSPNTTYYWLIYGGPTPGVGTGWQQFRTPVGDTTPPTCNSLTFNPVSPTLVSNTVTVIVNATDNAGGSGIKEVDFYANNATNGSSSGTWDLLGTTAVSGNSSVNWVTSNPSHTVGTHLIAINVLDNAGNWKYWNQSGGCNATYTLNPLPTTGTLTVNVTPSNISPQPQIAVTTGGTIPQLVAQGTTSGGTISFPNLNPATYAVNFGSVTGYSTPFSASATITAGNTTTVTGAYSSKAVGGYIAGYVFLDDGAGGGIAGNGVKDGGEAITQDGLLYVTIDPQIPIPCPPGPLRRPCLVDYPVTINNGSFVSGSLGPGNYRLDLSLATYRAATQWNGSNNYYLARSDFNSNIYYTAPDSVSYPITVSSGATTNVYLGIRNNPNADGVISGTIFNDNGAGSCAGNGIMDCGESGTNNAQLAINESITGNGYNCDVVHFCTLNSNGQFTFSKLVPASYHLTITPNSSWPTTRWSYNAGSRTYQQIFGSNPASYYTRDVAASNPDYPLVISHNTLNVQLGLNNGAAVPTSLTINVYKDNNGDGVINGSDALLTGQPVQVNCSPLGGGCQGGLNLSSGTITINNLTVGQSYTLTYNANGTVYQSVTGGSATAGSCAGPSCTIGSLPSGGGTVNFLVNQNSLPWIQVWDGDVYSHYNANSSTAGISITVNSNPTNPPYHPVFVQTNNANAGGVVVTRAGSAGATCNSFPCSERSFLVANYSDPAIAWPAYLTNLTGSGCPAGDNVCFVNSSLSITAANRNDFRSGGQYYNKVVLVSGDVTIDGQTVSDNSGNPAINVFLVAKNGKITISGNGGNNELIISGGLYAQNGFDLPYSLNNNTKPAIVVKYNPNVLLIQPSSVSQPAYTWREVNP